MPPGLAQHEVEVDVDQVPVVVQEDVAVVPVLRRMYVSTLYPARLPRSPRAVRTGCRPELASAPSDAAARLFTAWMEGASVTASMNAVVVLVAMTLNARNHRGKPESA